MVHCWNILWCYISKLPAELSFQCMVSGYFGVSVSPNTVKISVKTKIPH